MAICAQQAKIPGVSGPIFEAPTPNVVPVLRPEFAGRINVVNIKGAVVAESALCARTAERFDNGNLAFPVAAVFVGAVPVFSPVSGLALARAKAIGARGPTFFAVPLVAPSVGQVALLAAKRTSSIADAVRVHLVRFPAVLAGHIKLFLSHVASIARSASHYFDIACRRIEQAYAQGKLFEHEPAKPEQMTL